MGSIVVTLGFPYALDSDKLPHGNIPESVCSNCHNETRLISRSSITQQCLDCHSEFIPEHPEEYAIHAPLFEPGCTECHKMHPDDDNNLLRENKSDLCFKCHEGIFNTNSRYSHEAEECGTCHDPHFAKYTRLFIANPVSLCSQPCHDGFQKKKSHPVGRGVIDPNTGEDMTCTSSCHVYHSSEYKALTPMSTRKLCESCHENKF